MSTDFETIIPCKAVEAKALAELVGQISAVTGQPIGLRQVYVLSTPQTNVALMLDQLRDTIKAGTNGNGKKPAATTKASKRGRRKIKAMKKASAGPRSWIKEGSGEVFSAVALKKLIAGGSVPVHTVFVNGKGEKAVVLQDEEGRPQLIKEPKA